MSSNSAQQLPMSINSAEQLPMNSNSAQQLPMNSNSAQLLPMGINSAQQQWKLNDFFNKFILSIQFMLFLVSKSTAGQ